MRNFEPGMQDRERLIYLISIRWQNFVLGLLGLSGVVMIYGIDIRLMISGGLAGICIPVALIGSASRKEVGLIIFLVLFLVAMYFLPSYGREFRGQVMSYFFFVGFFVFSLVILIIKFVVKKLNLK